MKKFHDTGRTVREIVEHHPEQISEVWCRKIYRQLLQLLERQYAMQLPRRAITPDTVFVHDKGNLLLLPSFISDPMPEIADDLTALARIVHYAITQEVVPTGPLRGRVPEGFSDSLVNAIDRSMAFDPARRPRTIDELRELLGIVALRPMPSPNLQARAGQAMPAQPGLFPLPLPKQTGRKRPLHRQRWAWAGAGAAVLLGTGLVVLVDWRRAPGIDHLALTPPAHHDTPSVRPGTRPAPQVAAASPARAPDHATTAALAVSPHPDTTKAPVLAAKPRPKRAVSPAVPLAPVPAPPRDVATAVPAAPEQAAAGAVLTLRIQPWGRVYVDGVERGISPPVKRLALAPGRHVVLVANPGSRDRVLEVDTADGDRQVAVDFDKGR